MTTLNLHAPRTDFKVTIDKPIMRLNVGRKVVKNIGGVIGLVITYPIFFAVRVAILLSTRSLYKKTIKFKSGLDRKFSSLSEQEVISTHLHLENLKLKVIPELDTIQRTLKSAFPESFLLRFMTGYVSATKDILLKEVDTFKNAAYPTLTEKISDEHRNELIEKFKSFGNSDWDDDSYDIYNTVYLK